MAHSNRLPLRHLQLVARRREHTPARPSTLDLAQTQVKLPLQAVNPPQAQAHLDTLPNKHSSLPTVCPNSLRMDSQATQTRPRNSRHMASLRMVSQLATRLLKPDISSRRQAWPSRACKESPSSSHRWAWANSRHSNRSRFRSLPRG